MTIDVAGKTVLLVCRQHDPHRAAPSLFNATIECNECRAVCSIAPASIERLRAHPLTVVLCIECGMRAHAINPFDHFEPVSLTELAETYRAKCRNCGRTGQAHLSGEGCDRFER